jgi:hypothetical protein
MQCKDVELALEQNGFSPLPEATRGHVAGCPACSSLVADFARITLAARELPAEMEPPSRVWVSLRAQLEAEGIIRDPQIVIPGPSTPWWQGFAHLFSGRVLATATLALVVFAAGYLQMSRKSPAAPSTFESAVAGEPFAAAGQSLDQEEQNLGPMQTASLSGSSSVDTSLRENLATLNAFIKECRKRLQENPHDQVARDYLSAAYQQKAEILAAMMERGRSVN